MANKTHDLIENKMILNLTETQKERKKKKTENIIKITSFLKEHRTQAHITFGCERNEQSAFCI